MMDATSKILIHTVSKYLQDEFEPVTLGDFHDADALKLFSQLKEILPASSIVKRLDLVEHTFKKFFNNLGKIQVSVKSLESIKIATSIDPKTLKALKLLENYAEHLDDSQGPNLLIINENTTSKLREEMNCADDESFREIIRKVLPFVFEVGEKYAILFGQSRITIRLHMEKPSQEQRFNGLPTEELESIVSTMFPELDEELPSLMKRSFKENFDFGALYNEEFEEKHIRIMQQELLKIIKLRSDQDSEVNKGIVNFILRKHFELYHTLLAEQLVAAIMDKKGNSEVFLNYYTQKTINLQGVKYKIPQIIDSEGTVWSLPNIKNIASQHRNDQNELAKKDEFIDKMEKILDTIDDDIEREQKEVGDAKQTFQKTLAQLHEIGNALSASRNQLKTLRSSPSFNVEHEAKLSAHLAKLQQKELQLMKLRDASDRNVTKQENDVVAMISKKENTTIRLNSEIDKLEAMKKKMSAVKKRYDLMTAAIGIALSKKKERLA